MEAFEGKIKFYDDQINVKFSPDFNEFKNLLGEILGITEDFLINLKISYKDEDGDKIALKNEDDYKLFIEEIKKNQKLNELTIEVKEESSILIKQYSSSIFSYLSKNNSGNINIENNINKDDNINNKKENFNNEININNKNNIDIDNIIDENFLENKNNILIKDNNVRNKDINHPNDNIKNEQKEIAYKVNLDNIIDQNINNEQKNNINNINEPKNRQINNIKQPKNQNPRQHPQNLNNENNNSFLFILSFPYTCCICKKGPIYRSIYFCKKCDILICPECELKEGPTHLHALCKAQNSLQFEGLNIMNISGFEKFMGGVGNSIEGAYKSVVGFFSGGNNNNNSNQNKNNDLIVKGPQLVSLVQIARNCYDLRNITDFQIEQALIKTKGNVDEAIVLLFGQ